MLVTVSGLLTARTVSANQELDATVRRQGAQLLYDLAEREAGVSPMSAVQFALASWRHDQAVGYGALLRQHAVFHDVAEVDIDRYAEPMDVVATTPTGHVAVSATAAGALTAWRDPWGDTPESWSLGTVKQLKAIRVSDDGTKAATIDTSASIRVWDLVARREPVLVRPPSPESDLTPLDYATMEISPSGRHVVLANDTGDGSLVEVWDVARRSRLTGFAQPPGDVSGVAAIDDESGTVALLEATTSGSMYVVRRLDTGAEVRMTKGPKQNEGTARQGRMALRCEGDVLTGRDMFTGEEVFHHTVGACASVATDLTGEFLGVSPAGESGSFSSVTYFDPRNGRAYQSSTPNSALTAAQNSAPSGGAVVLRSEDGTPVILHMRGTAVVRMKPPRPIEEAGGHSVDFSGHADPANPTYSADGSLMAVVDGPRVSLYDTRTRRRVVTAEGRHRSYKAFLAFTPDNARLLTFDDENLLMLDTRDLAESRRIPLPRPPQLAGQKNHLWIRTVAVADDHTAVTLFAGLLTRWNLDNGAAIGEPLPVATTARDLALAADKSTVLGTPDRDRVLVNVPEGQRWWNLRSRTGGDLVAPEPNSQMIGAALSGTRLTIQYMSGRAYVHDLVSGVTSKPLPLTAHVTPIGFTPDGKLVGKRAKDSLFGGDGELIEVWDPKDSVRLGEFRLPNGSTSPKMIGSRLVAVNKYGFMWIDLDPADWFRSLCDAAGRDYTAFERDRLPQGTDHGNPCS
ncbi:WD40 repeat domain-containing protein [Saccharothrix obliqua]|uniref:WD40 repeat domain-containing protein n=1 Tax=Saccharothrix obliqua TaxID=2861747 RepID=UPI001C5FF806|nr:hypothetical protein [Saccharothrix obliqua]MBW4722310.1 hypothetical protein [Saccharothrix obliqua]